MKEDMKEDSFIFVVALAVAVMSAAAGFGVGYLTGYDYGGMHVQEEAIKQGCAEYVPDQFGRPKWKWKRATTILKDHKEGD